MVCLIICVWDGNIRHALERVRVGVGDKCFQKKNPLGDFSCRRGSIVKMSPCLLLMKSSCIYYRMFV